MPPPILLAVPNVSEGRDQGAIARIAAAFAGAQAPATPARTDTETAVPEPRARLLDTHTDADHHRSVYTLAGRPGQLSDALLKGAREAIATIDLSRRDAGSAGQHPHVGALDVVPIVYLDHATRGAACAEALVTAERLANELALPIFLYGELTGQDKPAGPRTRAQLRRGGLPALTARMAGANSTGEGPGLIPDFGPAGKPHPTAGVTLLAARPPLVAFNLQLQPPATLQDARRIAAEIREGAERGIPGLRAIGIQLTENVAQVSMNVERPFETPLAEIVAAVARRAPVASAELVGLAPRAAFESFPEDGVPIPGFDPARHLIENAIGCF